MTQNETNVQVEVVEQEQVQETKESKTKKILVKAAKVAGCVAGAGLLGYGIVKLVTKKPEKVAEVVAEVTEIVTEA